MTDRLRVFRQSLKEAGFVEGQDVTIEYRSAEDQVSLSFWWRISSSSEEGCPAVPLQGEAKAATTTVPIVFASGGDPSGIASSPTSTGPGGNVTGVSFISTNLRRSSSGSCVSSRCWSRAHCRARRCQMAPYRASVHKLRAAASAMGQQIDVVHVSSDGEIESASTTLIQSGALHVGVGVLLVSEPGTDCRAAGPT